MAAPAKERKKKKKKVFDSIVSSALRWEWRRGLPAEVSSLCQSWKEKEKNAIPRSLVVSFLFLFLFLCFLLLSGKGERDSRRPLEGSASV